MSSQIREFKAATFSNIITSSFILLFATLKNLGKEKEESVEIVKFHTHLMMNHLIQVPNILDVLPLTQTDTPSKILDFAFTHVKNNMNLYYADFTEVEDENLSQLPYDFNDLYDEVIKNYNIDKEGRSKDE